MMAVLIKGLPPIVFDNAAAKPVSKKHYAAA